MKMLSTSLDLRPPRFEPSFECVACEDSGWLNREDESGRKLSRRCECWLRKHNSGAISPQEQRAKEAGVPPRYRAYTKAAWEAEFNPWSRGSITSQLEGWTGRESPERWLVLLHGTYRTRKTSMATALFLERLESGDAGLCRWFDFVELVDSLEDAIDSQRGEIDSHEVWRRAFCDPGLALYDDIGAVRARKADKGGGDWWRERFAAGIRHREMHCLPTIITANFESIDDLAVIDPTLPGRLKVPLALKPGAWRKK